MKEITKKWFEFAESDLKNAEILFKNKSYEGCIWHCHQALEKYMKGVLVEIGKPIRKTHDLPSLLNDTNPDFPKDILEFVQELNAYYQPSRYPDTALVNPLSYNRATANKLLKLTKTLIKWLQFQTK
ncbi:MAG: HEPN domain-containing protein [Candidatus Taylorbacteria bacterium]|nr:HEPN domain-containing protein [Candidatus Taylorbacteria bacterium]